MMAALWFLSSRPLHLPDTGIQGMDKLLHFSVWALLAGAIALYPGRRVILRPRFWTLIVIAVASFYGVMDELHQSFVPGRDASIFDWVADTLGAAAGGMVASRVLPKWWKHR